MTGREKWSDRAVRRGVVAGSDRSRDDPTAGQAPDAAKVHPRRPQHVHTGIEIVGPVDGYFVDAKPEALRGDQ